MGIFAKLFGRSSSTSTQEDREVTPAGDSEARELPTEPGGGSAAVHPEGGEPGGVESGGAGTRGREEVSSAEARAATDAPADAHGPGESEGAADAGTAAAAGGGPGEAGVGIPKQPSADEAADSETGENARK